LPAAGDGYRVRWYVRDPVARIAQGDRVQLHSEYQSGHAADDVMGIMLLYVKPA